MFGTGSHAPSYSAGIFFVALSLFVPSVSFSESGYVRPEKLIMMWDYISEKGDNAGVDKRVVQTGLDVILPTWFAIRNGNGDVSSLADRNYIKWAHGSGIKVWALFENRSDDTLSFRALSNGNSREKIIRQIAGFVREYGLDGINIDFEAMRPETGKFFEQFITELYAVLKPLGIPLSVDISIPFTDVRKVFDVGLVAGNSDYIVAMAYDEHHRDSKVIGPVAAIGWVKQGIEDALRYVSPGKLILGIPFYTRVWFENRESGELRITSELKGIR
ncbi:MAG: glycosyl hydrolase family 18 protein, partial [Treponema sp.]|nr:glycosyl hydrolase family 18 protein [Treponema sp.]